MVRSDSDGWPNTLAVIRSWPHVADLVERIDSVELSSPKKSPWGSGDDPTVRHCHEGARREFVDGCPHLAHSEPVPGRVNPFAQDRWDHSSEIVRTHLVGEGDATQLFTVLKEPPKHVQVWLKIKVVRRTHGVWNRRHLDRRMKHIGERLNGCQKLLTCQL